MIHFSFVHVQRMMNEGGKGFKGDTQQGQKLVCDM